MPTKFFRELLEAVKDGGVALVGITVLTLLLGAGYILITIAWRAVTYSMTNGITALPWEVLWSLGVLSISIIVIFVSLAWRIGWQKNLQK